MTSTTHSSVLLASVSGNALLQERIGTAEAAQAVDRCIKRIQRAVEGFDGRFVRNIGDELMAVFDNLENAFQAALEMQKRIADLPPVSGLKLDLRIGFAYGTVREESGWFTGEAISNVACLADLAKPGQILTNLLVITALPAELRALSHELDAVATNVDGQKMRVFELGAPESTLSASLIFRSSHAHEIDHALLAGAGLCLNYAEEIFLLNDSKPLICMGRDIGSDVLVRDPRASRNHARIERIRGQIVLIDESTNGTYVTFEGKKEFVVCKTRCVLHGQGKICFAASAHSQNADCASFEVF